MQYFRNHAALTFRRSLQIFPFALVPARASHFFSANAHGEKVHFTVHDHARPIPSVPVLRQAVVTYGKARAAQPA